MSGLFSTFNIAKSGMNVQQQSINVTSHNIANSNTEGYSRQRAKIETTRPLGGTGINSSIQAGQIGTGAQIQTIERIRDNFLDYQIRGESSLLGKYEIRNDYLYEVESIFNEPSDTGLSSLMGKFFDSFQELSKQPNSSNTRTVVAQQSQALAEALNSTYTKLEDLKSNTKDMIKNNVTEVNSILEQLDRLNQEVISVSVSGNSPNDLMDKRDLLLDNLSNKFGIQVDKKEFNGLNVKPSEVGNMTYSTLVNSSPNGDALRFSYIDSVELDKNDASKSTYIITYYKKGSMDSEANRQTLKVTDITKDQAEEILNSRILWSDMNGQAVKADEKAISDGETINYSELMLLKPESGTISGLITVQEDIDGYIDQLNKLAKALAFSVNAIHSGVEDPLSSNSSIEKDYLPFFVNKDIASYGKDKTLNNLDATLYAESEITAKNISINKEILEDVMKIKTKTHDNLFSYTSENDIDGDGDGARALAIAKLRNSLIRLQDINESVITRGDMFDKTKGGSTLSNNGLDISNANSGMTMDSYFKDTVDRLGVQAQEAQRMVSNQELLLGSIEETRASVSGVSLDEEMANLIQFQHAYNANAKIISTVDELLEVIINGLKR